MYIKNAINQNISPLFDQHALSENIFHQSYWTPILTLIGLIIIFSFISAGIGCLSCKQFLPINNRGKSSNKSKKYDGFIANNNNNVNDVKSIDNNVSAMSISSQSKIIKPSHIFLKVPENNKYDEVNDCQKKNFNYEDEVKEFKKISLIPGIFNNDQSTTTNSNINNPSQTYSTATISSISDNYKFYINNNNPVNKKSDTRILNECNTGFKNNSFSAKSNQEEKENEFPKIYKNRGTFNPAFREDEDLKVLYSKNNNEVAVLKINDSSTVFKNKSIKIKTDLLEYYRGTYPRINNKNATIMLNGESIGYRTNNDDDVIDYIYNNNNDYKLAINKVTALKINLNEIEKNNENYNNITLGSINNNFYQYDINKDNKNQTINNYEDDMKNNRNINNLILKEINNIRTNSKLPATKDNESSLKRNQPREETQANLNHKLREKQSKYSIYSMDNSANLLKTNTYHNQPIISRTNELGHHRQQQEQCKSLPADQSNRSDSNSEHRKSSVSSNQISIGLKKKWKAKRSSVKKKEIEEEEYYAEPYRNNYDDYDDLENINKPDKYDMMNDVVFKNNFTKDVRMEGKRF